MRVEQALHEILKAAAAMDAAQGGDLRTAVTALMDEIGRLRGGALFARQSMKRLRETIDSYIKGMEEVRDDQD